MSGSLVIVGAGHASGQLIASLRQLKYEGKIVLIGDEPSLPYQRPPLSKKFLAGELAAERLLFKPAAFYEDDQLDVRLGTSVTAIDRDNRCVSLADGTTIDFDRLVISTGSDVRRLSCDGADLAGIHYLRTIEDVDRIRASLSDDSRVAIVGAGYIGLEVAAVLRARGHDVTVVEAADRVMSRVVSPQVSAFFDDVHRSRGVNLMLSTGVSGFVGEAGHVTGVKCSDGTTIDADVVVVGIGILPNDQLARDAGLDVDDGIVVDEFCVSSDAGIYAMGDCTKHPNSIYDRSLRLESVHNALEQAKTIAALLAAGEAAPYRQVPWFWSDQYEFKLQIVGLSQGYDDVVIRGNPDDGSFSCVYLKDGRMIALDCVNSPRDFMQAKTLISTLPVIDKALLADSEKTFKQIGEEIAG